VTFPKSGREAAEAPAIRLVSASIAATTVITAVRAAARLRMASERRAIPSLALRALSKKAAVSAGGSRTPNTTARPRIWFSKVTHWPTSFLCEMISERTPLRPRRGVRPEPHKTDGSKDGEFERPFAVPNFRFFRPITASASGAASRHAAACPRAAQTSTARFSVWLTRRSEPRAVN
jgi:hypothetical protein